MLEAALERATAINVPATVAILDVSREIVAFGRQDRAPVLSGEVATAKAFTAVSLRLPTAAFTEATGPNGPFFGLQHASSRGLVTFAGGVPLVVDGEVIGAIGASGGSIDEDLSIVQAALDLFEGWNN
jgi:uncharacterized protein GlcG (DUF336 family)